MKQYLLGGTYLLLPKDLQLWEYTWGVAHQCNTLYTRYTDRHSMPWPRMLCFDALVLKISHWSLSILWYRWTFQSEI